MAKVHSLQFPLGNFKAGEIPPLLTRQGPALLRNFRRTLLDYPQHFIQQVRLSGHPLLWVDWVALCKTAGLVVLRSGRPAPEAFCLLLTGLESEDDLETIRRHATMFRRHWPKVESAVRPLAVCGYNSPSLMANSAVHTVFSTFANALFALLGVGEDGAGEADGTIR
jgi:hypothetical protein